MMKKTVAFLAAFSLGGAALFAHPRQIASFKELEEEFAHADENTLVIFDVDEVLITSEDLFLQPHAVVIFDALIEKAMAKASSEKHRQEIEEALSLTLIVPKRPLIEADIPERIKNLQERGIKVIALTACSSGPFGLVPKLERWRIEHLKNLGIDFSSSFKQKRQAFTHIAHQGKKAPLFEEGILFSDFYEKGAVLNAFLKHCDWTPSKVIFIDDRKSNLENVSASMRFLNIDCSAYHYIGAQQFFKEIDEALLTLQFEHLLQKRQWLSDEEIKKLR